MCIIYFTVKSTYTLSECSIPYVERNTLRSTYGIERS